MEEREKRRIVCVIVWVAIVRFVFAYVACLAAAFLSARRLTTPSSSLRAVIAIYLLVP